MAKAYWRAIEAGNLHAAATFVRHYDNPWMEFAETVGGHFDAMYHGAQEVFGIAGRWRREPYASMTDAEMERLRALFAGLPAVGDRGAAVTGPPDDTPALV